MQPPSWYWQRLRRMSAAEVAYRGWQFGYGRLQMAGRLRASQPPPANPARQAGLAPLPAPAIGQHDYIGLADQIVNGEAEVFNNPDARLGALPNWNRDPLTGTEAPLSFGKTLDYRDEQRVGNIKYLWEPNRHQHLVTLLQAWRLGGDRRYLDTFAAQLQSWLDQCPYLLGPNWSSSLELAIRLINWSFCWRLLDDDSLSDSRYGDLRNRWLASIYQHCHFIRGHQSRFSSANNHLLGEITGLFIATCTWPMWPQMDRWRQQALQALLREAELQNAPDGVNREQAIFYHQYVVDYLLLAGLVSKDAGVDLPAGYWQRIENMMDFMASIMDVAGTIPMIGDDDGGCICHLSANAAYSPYRSLLATGAVLFGRPEFRTKAGALDDRTRWLLGPTADQEWQRLASIPPGPLPVRRAFADGGYYLLGRDFETPQEIRMLVDCGPLGYLSLAGHGHADALSIWLSCGGREFLIDPGTYTYHSEKQWRDYFRGTAAHNTVQIDGLDQSVITGNFMWSQHARSRCIEWRSSDSEDVLTGSHDGYRRLRDPVGHQRRLQFDKKNRRFMVEDHISCTSAHQLARHWHFHEDCQVTVDGRTVIADNGALRITLVAQGSSPEVQVWRGSEDPPGGWVSRRFGLKVPCTTVAWLDSITGSCVLRTEIECP